MNRRLFAASVLTAAIGVAAGVTTASADSMTPMKPMTQAEMMKVRHENQQRMATQHLQKCYGVNAIGRNDCAAGAHSCAGQATKARDPASFVLLPAGDCAKLAGGSLKPG